MLKHEGHSGFMVRLNPEKTEVEKLTYGFEAAALLRASFNMQMNEILKRELYPINTVPIFSVGDYEDRFAFRMPFLDYDSGFTGNLEKGARKKIVMSLANRGNDHRLGFKNIVKEYIQRFPNCDLKLTLKAHLETCSDLYPYGYAHGDFGFANMLINQANVYIVDFTPSFIYSPLIDLATMELSLFSNKADVTHRKVFRNSEEFYEGFKQHKDILRMCKVLSFARDNDTKDRRAELVKMFYGIRGVL